MSGGAFDYKQYAIEQIADDIEAIIHGNEQREYPFSDETIEKFRHAAKALRQAKIMAHRIDWLVSDDDGEDAFHVRWKEDLAELERLAAKRHERGL